MLRKRFMSLLTAAILLVFAMSVLTGCGSGEELEASRVSLAVIGGGHACMPVFSTDCEAIYNGFYDAAITHGSVTMVNCDGAPKVYYQADIPEDSVSGLSDNKKNRIAESYVTQLQSAYLQACAETGEVNTLKAITLAARALEDETGEKEIVIVDSGLQTTGYMNFTNGLLGAEPEAVVSALESMEALPDLTGTEVVWIGLGDTIAPQEELSERQKEQLKSIWGEVLSAAGASNVTFDNGFSTGVAYENVPQVTTVKVEDETIDVATKEASENPVIEVAEEPIDTIILDSTRLQFVGDEAIFVDENEANTVLAEVAAELIDHPDNKVYVIGTTAGSESNEFTQSLSEARASTVRDSLISLGVPEEQIADVIGLASSDPWHEYDLDENGNMIEEIATRNRKTIIMDVGSEEALLLPAGKTD